MPFLILGNKIDKATALPEKALKSVLGINVTSGKDNKEVREGERPLEVRLLCEARVFVVYHLSPDILSRNPALQVFMCSVVKTTGYADGFKWLAQYLK